MLALAGFEPKISEQQPKAGYTSTNERRTNSSEHTYKRLYRARTFFDVPPHEGTDPNANRMFGSHLFWRIDLTNDNNERSRLLFVRRSFARCIPSLIRHHLLLLGVQISFEGFTTDGVTSIKSQRINL